MRDKADAWQMQITTLTWEFEQALRDVGVSGINHKKDDSTWSVGEILSHLIRVNESYYPVFDQLIAGTYETPLLGKVPFLVKSIGNLLYRSMTSKAKVRTFKVWEPERKEFDLGIINRFKDHQMQLSAYIEKLDPYFETVTVIASPANRFLVYSLDKTIDIVIAHEKRHLEQIKTLLEEQRLDPAP